LTEESIAHWFVQDGHNNVTKDSKSVFFSTHCFTNEECLYLSDRLKKEFDLTTRVYSGPTIRVMANSYFRFMSMVSPFVKEFACFNYKIDTSKAPKNRKGTPWTGAKLTKEQVQNIRKLRPTHKLKELAEQFDVSISTIGKIANFQMYKPDSLEIAGKADVKLGVRYAH